MTDQRLILRKLASLREHVNRMRRRHMGNLNAFVADVDLQDALGMSLLVSVQEALDIALHFCSNQQWGLPASYAEAFALLGSHGVITPEVAASLAKMAALRNRLAHGYASVEMARIWHELPSGIAALETFASSVASHLGPSTSIP
ncbi:MAG: DUF86 domain-containing protein [Myxococcales bacterium]|nr:DUF86 domain-containing protein [Myxococcales bacterium]